MFGGLIGLHRSRRTDRPTSVRLARGYPCAPKYIENYSKQELTQQLEYSGKHPLTHFFEQPSEYVITLKLLTIVLKKEAQRRAFYSNNLGLNYIMKD